MSSPSGGLRETFAKKDPEKIARLEKHIKSRIKKYIYLVSWQERVKSIFIAINYNNVLFINKVIESKPLKNGALALFASVSIKIMKD